MNGNEKYQDWKRRYKNRLIELGGLTEEEAEENFNAAGDLPDYDYEPEDVADDEMSYWAGDAI